MISQSLYLQRLVFRQFHTSRPKHVSPPTWFALQIALKVSAAVAGRLTGQWIRQLPSGKRTLLVEHFRRHKYKYVGTLCTISAAFGHHYYTHLETEPITGRRRYNSMTAEELKDLSDSIKKMLAKEYANKMLSEDSKQTQRAARVLQKLIGANLHIPGVKNTKGTVQVIDIDEQNAFVLPSGDIYFMRGLVDKITNDDQLAMVLAHEISHPILAHTAERESNLMLPDVVAIFGIFIIWTIFPSRMMSLISTYILERLLTFTMRLPYSRRLEHEADEIGLMLSAKASFNVHECIKALRMLDEANKGRIRPEFCDTHPTHANRAKFLTEKLPRALEISKKCNGSSLVENKPLDALNIQTCPTSEVYSGSETA